MSDLAPEVIPEDPADAQLEALQIVGEELAVTLGDARAALEQFADGDGSPAALERCAGLVHSARGVLRLTETYGASLLAEEMEETCRFLLEHRKKPADAEETVEALLRAAVQLPAYVDGILAGGRDIPLVLLPLLNDLRAARGRPLLSESTLLLLNLSVDAQPREMPERRPNGEDPTALARATRPRFQLALLGFIKGDNVAGNLAAMRTVLAGLEDAATSDAAWQLWWVTGAVLEALADGGLDNGVAIKRLLGQADREIKRMISLGEARFAQQPPSELINNLLYYVARATNTGERVAAVRAAFNLSEMVPGDAQVASAREQLSAPSTRLMETVADAIREDLSRVKDVLDIYVRTGMEHPEELTPQLELLKKIADTLGVLGLGDLRELVGVKRQELSEIIDGSIPASENALEGMATALLSVEDRLAGELRGLIAPVDSAAAELPPGDADEYREVTQAVMRECIVNLAHVKDAVIQVIKRTGDSAVLDAVPQHLRGINAGLMLLNKARAVEVVEGITRHLGEAIQPGYEPVGEERFERLADAVVSLEYYLETLQAGRREPLYMLDNAARCLESLDSMEPPVLTPVSDSSPSATLAISHDATLVDAGPPPQVIDASQASEIDPELLELFIEEAREAIELVRSKYPDWAGEQADANALTEMRRAFHTLKGSGRMVGAELIGEFCWSVEDLLNKVINQTVACDDDVVALVGESVEALPELLEQLEVGSDPSVDVAGLIARASQLAGQDEAAPPAEPTVAANVLHMDSADADSGDDGLDLDFGDLDLPIAGLDADLDEDLAAGGDDRAAVDFDFTGPPAGGVDFDIGADETLAGTGNQPVGTLAGDDNLGIGAAGRGDTMQVPAAGEPAEPTLLVPGPDDADATRQMPADPDRTAELPLPPEGHDATVEMPPRAPSDHDATQEMPPRALSDHDATLELPPHAPADPDGTMDTMEMPSAPPPGDAAAPADGVPDGDLSADPVLLEILGKESEGHFEVIEAFIAECDRAAPPYPVPEDLFVACHTLHGSITMAKLGRAAELTGPLNELVRGAFDHGYRVGDAMPAACGEVIAAVRTILRAQAEPGVALPDVAPLEQRIRALTRQMEAELAVIGEEPDGDTSMLPVSRGEPGEAPIDERGDEPAEPIAYAAADEADESQDAATPDFHPEYDPEIAAIFAEECAELLEDSERALGQLAAGEPEGPLLEELQRYLHTIKGGARMSGLVVMGDLSHELETLLMRVNGGQLARDEQLDRLLLVSIDELHRQRDAALSGQASEPPSALLARIAAYAAGEPLPDEAGDEIGAGFDAEPGDEAAAAWDEHIVAGDEDAAEPAGDDEMAADDAAGDAGEPDLAAAGTPVAPAIPPVLDHIGELARELSQPPVPATLPDAAPPGNLAPPMEAPAAERREMARVDAGLLETLLNNAGEISIYHSRLTQQVSMIQFNLDELGQTVVRLREQLRSLELATEAQILYRHEPDVQRRPDFDPLELDRYSRIQQLSRALAETSSDVNSLRDLLQNLAGDTEALLVQQSRTTVELQDGLMRTRMVPFHQHESRLARLVRQTAIDHDKRAELRLTGSGELDRQMLEKMLPPFEHMLRNAVIHGIEPPAARRAAGKAETGVITIGLHREGSEVVIEVADDGRGLDVASIRRKARDQGLISAETPITDDEAMQLIFRPGFSTAERLTQSAGRGIGMDVVANEVTKLGGTLAIESHAGEGTKFTVRLPFTLAVTQALIVRAGGEQFALPLPTVEGIIRISREDFEQRIAQPDPCIEYGGNTYRFRHLGQFLGLGPSRLAEDDERISIILVRAGENSTALITDEMQDSREIVVKSVGAQLAGIRGISGATILGDGEIVMILDIGALVRGARPELEPPAPPEPETTHEPLALVVDDSITMRRVTQRFLERNGFRVLTAKDGIEALATLQDHAPDIILLDIEMPRMDGFEFATHVRNDERNANVPIVMITSRVSEKHKARAIELGVNDYLGKPYQEHELLASVQHLLESAGVR